MNVTEKASIIKVERLKVFKKLLISYVKELY